MRKKDKSFYVLISVAVLIIFFGLIKVGMAQAPSFFSPYVPWGINSYMYPFPFAPIPSVTPPTVFFPASYPAPIPYFNSPAFSPLTRVGAATIIISNPTAGTVSVVNPTVASTPAVTATAPAPLLSLLATIYSSALYEGLLSTANPLLFALLQNLFL
jgi:hypothetical protein